MHGPCQTTRGLRAAHEEAAKTWAKPLRNPRRRRVKPRAGDSQFRWAGEPGMGFLAAQKPWFSA